MSNLTEKLREVAQPSIISGIIAAGGVVYLFDTGTDMKIPFFGSDMNVLLATGLTVGGAVAVSEIMHDTVLEWIPHNTYVNAENRFLAPLLAGGGTYLLFKTGVSEDTSFVNSFALGAGSAVLGKYASNMISNKL